jgi:hypothetical protein
MLVIPKTNFVQIKKQTLEIFYNRTTVILGVRILLALFTLSALAFQPQKTIQETYYEK